MTTKLYSYLGMAQRAGKLTSGEENVLNVVRSGEATYVIISEDASDNTKKKISDKCSYFQVPFVYFGDRYELGRSIGKEYRAVIAVTDDGFAGLVRKCFENNAEVESIEERR